MFYNVVQTSSEISPSLRLLLKVCVWYRCQNRIEKYYHHDGEQKYYISKHRLSKEECFCNLCIAVNSNLLDKNCTQDKGKLQVILLLLIFPERNFARTL